MRRLLKSAFLLLLFSLLFISCKREATPRLYLDGTFSFSLCDRECPIEDADSRAYTSLKLSGYRNLSKSIGSTGEFIWLRTTFKIPENLKGRDLSMVIPYLHFASELYLNGEFIDDYGFMDEPLQEAGYTAQLFDFPERFLNQEGDNIIHIKVFLLGNATISQNVFVGEREDCWATSDYYSFWLSRVYIFFEGIMIGVFIVFLLLYRSNKKYKHYLYFSLIGIVSLVFFSNFFAGDLPFVGFHGGLPFFTYLKIARCLTFFMMEILCVLFIFAFLGIPHRKIDVIMRVICYTGSSIAVILAKDYVTLMKICPFLLAVTGIDVIIAFGMTFYQAFSKFEERRKNARFLLMAFGPFILALTADGIIKLVFNNILIPFLALPSYVITIVAIFSNFTMQYKIMNNRMEYLNRSLEDEVEIQTRKLTAANEKLEREQELAQEDMNMAALVQKKFFHAPNHPLTHWETAVRYEPLSIVSGDFFNYYFEAENLNGVSLFDASGHGVAASLVTMLAENIIQQAYKESLANGKGMAETLSIINDRFITAKGGIDNYLTGILLSTKENEDGSCTIVLSNAGHPNPLLYVSSLDTVEEILPDVDKPSFGAVGIKDFEARYSEIEFTMNSGDVLLLYTDGLIEMMNENHEEFGIDRVMTVLNEIHAMSASEMISALMFAFNAHVYSVPRTDDVSVIILKRK
ncbi:MAG: SpoIIE family protein phosphatase [Treponema sp.]|nr:SpoIIE family protein phosphatase [Treponema sp.]